MIVKEPYYFGDGRIGTLTKSDKFFKNITELDENGKEVIRPVNYKIRKKGTAEVYDVAIDILPFEYEELTEAEMVAEYDSNK